MNANRMRSNTQESKYPAEVEESVRTGLPFLEEIAKQQHGAMEALEEQLKVAQALCPKQ